MCAICKATKHALLATLVPEIGHRALAQGAAANVHPCMRFWARHCLVTRRPTETALHVLAISIASMHACVASRIPIIRSRGLIIEGALCFSPVHRSLGARDTCVREIAAEATLLMDSICPASQLTHFTLGVPIVRNRRLVLEAATTGRARDADEISSAAEATLHMLSVAITTEIAHLA